MALIDDLVSYWSLDESSGDFRLAFDSDGSPNRHFSGAIDEAGIWSRALSSAEISELYNAGAGRSYSYIQSTGGSNAERLVRIMKKLNVGSKLHIR